MVKEYRLSTINLLEEIVRWNETWQENYLLATKLKIKLRFEKDGENYFLKIAEEVKFLNKDPKYDDPFLLFMSEE